MAKKKKSSRGKAKASAPQHALPAGFWAQVGAVFLIAISVLLVLAWFGAGGPVLEWLHQTAISTIGYAVYVVPLLFIYVAVEIFKQLQAWCLPVRVIDRYQRSLLFGSFILLDTALQAREA